ncbi:MAG: hypothetical protein WCG78_00050 [Candidatus Omnitrophota bacterium]
MSTLISVMAACMISGASHACALPDHPALRPLPLDESSRTTALLGLSGGSAQVSSGTYPQRVLDILASDPSITAFTYDGTYLVVRSGDFIFRRYTVADGGLIGRIDLSRITMPDGSVLDRTGAQTYMPEFPPIQFNAGRLLVTDRSASDRSDGMIEFDLRSTTADGQFKLLAVTEPSDTLLHERYLIRYLEGAAESARGLQIVDTDTGEDKVVGTYLTRQPLSAVLAGHTLAFFSQSVEQEEGFDVDLCVVDLVTGTSARQVVRVNMEDLADPIIVTNDGMIAVAARPLPTSRSPIEDNKWEAQLFKFDGNTLARVALAGPATAKVVRRDNRQVVARSITLTPTKYLAVNRALGDGEAGPSLSIFDKHTGEPANLPQALFDNLAQYQFEYFIMNDDFLVIHTRSGEGGIFAFSLATGEQFRVAERFQRAFLRINSHQDRCMDLVGNMLVFYASYASSYSPAISSTHDLTRSLAIQDDVTGMALEVGNAGRARGYLLHSKTAPGTMAARLSNMLVPVPAPASASVSPTSAHLSNIAI